MPRPPKRRNRVNLKMECDAFGGCKPKTTIKNEGKFSLFGGPSKPPLPKPTTRYEWDTEKTPDKKSMDTPQTDVGLDIEEISPRGTKKLFEGSFQDAQKKNALKAAAEASKTFTEQNFPKFQEQGRKALLAGGADYRTISPTSKPGENKSIGNIPMSTIKEQQLRQQLGSNYDIAKEGKLRSRTKYEISPKGDRRPVKRIEYSPEAMTEMNLDTGVMKITDLTTGKTKYTKSSDTEVVKKPKEGVGKVKSMESVTETEANVPEAEVQQAQKAQMKAAVEATKKPGFFSKEAIRSRQRARRRRRYAQGSR